MADGSRARRRALRRVALALIAVLYAVSIPWYREGGAEAEILLGLPDWVAVALGCYVGAAVLNAWAWLITEVPESADSRHGEAG